MAGFIVQQKASSAPVVDDGLALAIWTGVRDTFHQDWAGQTNQYGKVDSGERWSFDFLFVDADFAVMYDPNPDHEGDPLEVGQEVNRSVGEKSNGYKLLKGLLKPAELALLDAGEPFDLEGAFGTLVQVVVTHSKKGWPQIDSTIPVSKAIAAKYAAFVAANGPVTA